MYLQQKTGLCSLSICRAHDIKVIRKGKEKRRKEK